jgi:DNA mismatch repair protein MutL
LLEESDSFILIDQHAAHERILYEELLQRREENEDGRSPGQLLLVPVRVHVTDKELAFLTDEEEHFRSLGFEYESFGGQSVVVRSVPAGSRFEDVAFDPAAALRAALDCLEEAHRTGNTVEDTEILHLVACKAAVKAHDRLSEDEIRLLLERLTALTNPYHCPHGRPVAIKLSKSEIEKLFGRIV